MLKFHNILHVNDPNHPNEISLVFDSQPFCIKCKILQDLTQSISLTCCMVDTRIDIYLTLSFFILKKFIKMLFALLCFAVTTNIYTYTSIYGLLFVSKSNKSGLGMWECDFFCMYVLACTLTRMLSSFPSTLIAFTGHFVHYSLLIYV